MSYETGELYETGLETLEAESFELGTEDEVQDADESPFSEVEEMESAAHLLEVTNEGELDQFIGSLLKRAAAKAGRALKTPLGRQLGGMVKGAIKQALPGVGATIGGRLVPGAGATAGRQLASRASQWLGLELEGLSPEDQEYEVARQLVRLAGAAARQASTVAPDAAPAVSTARHALRRAAQRFAPGLLRGLGAAVRDAARLSPDETGAEYIEEHEAAGGHEAGSPFGEVEEAELAAELLEVTDEAELDQFIGSLLKRAARTVGKALRTPLGQRIGGLVKGVVKKALPRVGAAVGGMIPGVGGALGGQFATQAGQALGLELEGLSPEDQEFEAAKQLVRLAGAAVQNAASNPGADASPAAAAQSAVVQAAQVHAPGLVRRSAGSAPAGSAAGDGTCTCGRRATGRWIRRGGKILLLGA